MQYLKLDEYLKIAKKILRKYHPLSMRDEDAISYVAYWGMKADEKFDEKKNDSRNGYRALYFLYGVKKWKRLMVSKQRQSEYVISLNYNNKDYDKGSFSDSIIDRKQKQPSSYLEENELREQVLNSTLLSKREKDMLIMYCFEGFNQEDIGLKYKISKQRVSSLIHKSRKIMEKELLDV